MIIKSEIRIPYYAPDEMNNTILLWMLVVAAAAWLYPCFKTFQTGNEKIFHSPLEVTVIAAFVLIEVLMNQSGALLSRTKGYPDFLDWMVWLGTFAATYCDQQRALEESYRWE